MAGQDSTWTTFGVGIVENPTLGQGKINQSGPAFWASFEPEFSQLGRTVYVLVDIINGGVPSSTVALYREIEAHYSKLVPQIISAVCSRISSSAEAVERGFNLESIDLREPLRPSTKSASVLRYRTDRSHFDFDWYVGVSRDYAIEYCGERD